MTQKINSINIPTSMAFRGGYDFKLARELGKNGQRKPIKVKGATLVWTFSSLDDAEWTWWTVTLLGNADYAEFTGVSTTTLYNDNRVEENFDHCIVYRPVRGNYGGSEHENVTVTITDIW